jgi:Uma2 family endonuclease
MTPAPTTTQPTLLTAEEFARQYSGEYVELIDGKVEPIPMPKFPHGKVCAKATRFFANFIDDNGLGVVCSNDTFVLTRRNPDRVRGADVCYWRKDRVPQGELPDLLPDPPDLVVEVRSPSDTWTKAFAKVIEYLEAGVRVVVLVDPDTATASVYRPDELQQIHDNGDELTIPDVLPGLSVPVKKFFE